MRATRDAASRTDRGAAGGDGREPEYSRAFSRSRAIPAMPELPEVEAIRRRIRPLLAGARIERCQVDRRDVVRATDGARTGRLDRSGLGADRTIETIDRRGKQLVIRFADDGGLVIRLGMSGRLDLHPAGTRRPTPAHRHVRWTIESARHGRLRLEFIDPRRFGGVHLARDRADLESRLLGGLGPEGVTVTGRDLHDRLGRTRRAVKVALLDQAVVAGVGNIYADESLHAAGLHPGRPGDSIAPAEADRLAEAIREVLAQAIEAGGSTIRDHRLPDGSSGDYAARLAVYGRGGAPCPTCGTILEEDRFAMRTTTWCPTCQHVERRTISP